ncbi:MAG: WG repeat-containing protein [Acidovorax sp.]|uniref:WG repeat-containing protein n=1 Tax=Acidovorax sp. TaxID=1872122 RepID=UPI00391D86AC
MHNENNPQAPWLAHIPLDARHQQTAHVIVHPGRAIVPPEGLRGLLRFDPDGQGGWVGAAQADDGRWGYVDGEGHWRVPPTLQNTRSFSDEGLGRFCQAGRWGFVDVAGTVVIAPAFADARPFRNGLSAVLVGDEDLAARHPDQVGWRIIDREGRFTCPGFFHDISVFSGNGLARATLWNKSSNQRLQGFVNSTGQWVIEPRFRRVLPFGDAPVTAASLDGERFGLIDARGQWVLEPRYPRIEAFNTQGLAYFDETNAWDNGHGYLDVRGKVVVKGGRHLSPYMACGIAANCYAGTRYLNAQGEAVAGPRLSFGSHFFPQAGFAVVRTAAASSGRAAPAPDAPAGAWGLLHPDGRWVPAPDHMLEPLTNLDGWLVGPQTGTPLVPFLTRDGQLAYIDGEGTVVWRAHYDGQQVALLDARDEPLWRSAVREDCWPPGPFFNAPATDHLQGGLSTLDGIVPLAAQLLADAETRLHHLAAGDTLAPDEGGDSDGDDDEEDDDSADPEQVQARRTVVVRRIMRAYLSESHNGPYEFLCTELNQVVDTTRAALLQRLSVRFGTPDPNPEHAAPGHLQGDYTQGWPVALAKPLPGDSGALHESREQWLTLYKHSDAGDGDVWWELWLMAAPSVDALEMAQRARRQASAAGGRNGFAASAPQPIPQTDPEDGVAPDPAPGTERPTPQTREEWMEAVRADRYAIAHVPAPWLDEAMVDAALAANVEALAHVPPAWHTPERLAALIRRGAREAANIPPQCMTTEGLALARSLYAGDRDWDWRDESRSQIPTKWDHNSLYDVWGCLLTPALALKAVRAEAPLKDLAHWLRTEAVEQAALQADIYNISYIDKSKITPALAERAVRHDYGCLIEEIPPDMLTPALCLASVHTNGMSLEKIPEPLRSVDVCVAALQEQWNMLPAVPAPLRAEVTTRLIDDDLAQARRDGEPREGSHWHAQRAWARLWVADWNGAIADATLALDQVRYAQHPHYVLASAYRALGREREAALEASTVLSLQSPYTAQWDDAEDTQWLQELAERQVAAADDDALLEQLQTHPRTLADIPRERITHAMAGAALAADESAVEFVPKRLMTPARYATAVRQGVKEFAQVPADMLSEEACIAHVQDNGWHLRHVPEALRTAAVCAHAIRRSPSAIELVPAALLDEAKDAEARLPRDEDDDDADSGRSTGRTANGWLMRQLLKSTQQRHASATSRLKHKGVMAAWMVQTALGAKSQTPPTLWGPAGWLEQRPVIALALHWLLGVAALVAHAFVSVGAWRAEGPWVGLGTFALMGFADAYWAWRFALSTPHAPALAAAAMLVVAYAFGWRWLYARIGRVYAARLGQ